PVFHRLLTGFRSRTLHPGSRAERAPGCLPAPPPRAPCAGRGSRAGVPPGRRPGFLERQERTHPPGPAVAVHIDAPGAGPAVVRDALDPAPAVAPGTAVVLAGFLLADDAEVLPAAVQGVVVAEEHLLPLLRAHELAVQVQQAVLAVHLGVPDGVPAPSPFAPVAPPELRAEGGVGLLNTA